MKFKFEDTMSFKILKITIFMLLIMSLFETVKQTIVPHISIWKSHGITIVFSTLCADIAAFFAIRKMNLQNFSLLEKNLESEQLKKELEQNVRELKEALMEVKTLKCLLPICSGCKKIRDDNGSWKQIESYLHDHSDLEFSHGLCPDCIRKLYPDTK